MKPFDYFIKKQEVKKCSPDVALSNSLIKDMKERIRCTNFLKIEKFPKIVFENTYDAIIDFANALLAKDGYKSYSHQASLVYLLKYKVDLATIINLDNIRFKRNSSKYYGQSISIEDAQEIKKIYAKLKPKINKILNQNK